MSVVAPSSSSASECTRLTIAAVYNDSAVIDRYLRPSVARAAEPVQIVEIDNTGNKLTRNIASLYNKVLKMDGPDVVAFLHPDITFDEHYLAAVLDTVKGLDARGEGWGAVGIVGRTWTGDYVWCHQTTEPVKVCCLDSCSVITRRSLGLRFDHWLFNEFHCYVEDFCLQLQAAGRPVYVVPGSAHHASATMSARGAQWGRYRWYRRMLSLKWRWRFGPVFTC